MSNNMDLGYEMFCYQCEQTANGKGLVVMQKSGANFAGIFESQCAAVSGRYV